jgi:hypothetical protein
MEEVWRPLSMLNERIELRIPSTVQPVQVMEILQLGHSYSWIVLAREPVLLAYGAPSIGNMPELFVIGESTLLLAGGEEAYVDRIQHVIDMLQRTRIGRIATKGAEHLG